MAEYQFTQNWFEIKARKIWDQLIPQANPSKILEVGSYEGASACYLIHTLGGKRDIEVHCVDTWEGGIEHKNVDRDMDSVEERFDSNIKIAIARAKKKVKFHKHKGFSDVSLATLLSEGKQEYFDFVYIDGSHQAPDVLCDAILGFKLLKSGGYMVFDDYIWSENLPGGKDLLRCPKPAIDAFININFRSINFVSAPLYQIYIQKV